jgi:hypothetical protein
MADSASSGWRQLVREMNRRDLTAVRRSLESGACTPLSIAIASEDIELVRVMTKHSPALSCQSAIENDHNLQQKSWGMISPVSENEPNTLGRNYNTWWSAYQSPDHSSIALAALLRTRGRLYAEEQDDVYHSLYR